MRREVNVGFIQDGDFKKISALKDKLLDIFGSRPAKKTKSDIENHIKILIDSGCDLDNLLVLGKMSGWSMDVTSELLDCYYTWSLGLKSLLISKYATDNKFKYKYPTIFYSDNIKYGMMVGVDSNYGFRVASQRKQEQVKDAQDFLKECIATLSKILLDLEIESNKEEKNPKLKKISLPEKPPSWDKLSIQFTNDSEIEIRISYNNKLIKTIDYIELGFYTGKKQQKQNNEWLFLRKLAYVNALYNNGASVSEIVSSYSGKKPKHNDIHQIKIRVSKKLQNIFGIYSNPLTCIGDRYIPLFELLPPKSFLEEPKSEGVSFDENFGKKYSADEDEGYND